MRSMPEKRDLSELAKIMIRSALGAFVFLANSCSSGFERD